MINLVAFLLFTGIYWISLYGLCALLLKFKKFTNVLLFCSLTGLAIGLVLISLAWLVFYSNHEKYPEQGEGTLWSLYFIGCPLSLILNIISVRIYEAVIVTVLAVLNWGILGVSVGLARKSLKV